MEVSELMKEKPQHTYIGHVILTSDGVQMRKQLPLIAQEPMISLVIRIVIGGPSDVCLKVSIADSIP